MCKYLHDLLRSAFWKALVLFAASLPAAGLPASPEQRVQTAATPQVTPQVQSDSVLQGKLIVNGSERLRLSTSGGDIVVTSGNPQILHTLQDARLTGRLVKLEGNVRPTASSTLATSSRYGMANSTGSATTATCAIFQPPNRALASAARGRPSSRKSRQTKSPMTWCWCPE